MNRATRVSPFELALRRVLVFGLIVVVAVPQARITTEWLGWLPLWLVGMPAVMLWALHGFNVPAPRVPVRPRLRAPQAVRLRSGV